MDKDFAIELTDKCRTDAEWLAVMRFGLDTLLKNPRVLMECIARRAEVLKQQSEFPSKVAADFAAELLDTLGLRFEVAR